MVGVLTTYTYTFLNESLMNDLKNVISEVGSWFSTNPLLMMMMTITLVGLGIKIIKSIKNAIAQLQESQTRL